MPKFREKPVIEEVEAKQFWPEQKPWPLGVEWESEGIEQDGSRYGGFYKLDLYGGFAFIHPGDWVVYQNGKRRVVRPREFEATYEPVSEGL